jgi:8-oxo-dGTP diphosphatase
MRRDAALILLVKGKRMLMQHRSSDATRSPNLWGFFGGGIDEGETPLQGVIRECKEELGYNLQKPKQIHVDVNPVGDFYVYVEKYDETKQLVLGEGQAMKWYSLSEIKDLDMIPRDKEIILKIGENIFLE